MSGSIDGNDSCRNYYAILQDPSGATRKVYLYRTTSEAREEEAGKACQSGETVKKIDFDLTVPKSCGI